MSRSVLGAALLAAAMGTTFAGSVQFEGSLVLAIDEHPERPMVAREARILLVDSDYEGNRNADRMTHVPVLEIPRSAIRSVRCVIRPCWWQPAPPLESMIDPRSTSISFFLHDSLVRFDRPGQPSPGEPIPGETFAVPPTFAANSLREWVEDDDEDLEFLDEGLWDGRDRGEGRVYARIDIGGGSITTEDEPISHPSYTEMVDTFTWTADFISILVSGPRGESTLRIDVAPDAAVIVRNTPAAHLMSLEALHFPEYYDLTTALLRPTWPERTRWLPTVDKGGEDVFCPPSLMKRKP